jgi:CheY-like chemotaxis protein
MMDSQFLLFVVAVCVCKEVDHMTEYPVESSLGAAVDLEKRKQIRVLYVDDEPGQLKMTEQCLKMQGQFLVDSVQSAEEAFRRLEKTKYDVIVSDYQMSRKGRSKFLRELRKSGSRIPFIMFSGNSKKEVAIEALNLGASQYLDKTDDPETVYGELAHSIREAVEIKEVETKLRDSEEKFRKIFDSANDYMIYLDTSGKILDINENTLKAFAGSKEDVVGKRFTDLDIFPADMSTFWEMFPKLLKGEIDRKSVV